MQDSIHDTVGPSRFDARSTLAVCLVPYAALVVALLSAIARWAGLIDWGPALSSGNLLASACLVVVIGVVLTVLALWFTARRRSTAGWLAAFAVALVFLSGGGLLFIVSYAGAWGP